MSELLQTTPSKTTIVKGKGNAIFTIHPYKKEGQWQFDDESRDVFNEAFVAGADDLLDLVCKGAEKCTAIFSSKEFPSYDLRLNLLKAEEGGSGDYYCEELKHDLWLCSCLNRYFDTPPETIFVQIKV